MHDDVPLLRNDRQEAILQSAERLFADQGFHAVTLRQIAEAAEVPLALVGYYFGRKNDLFRAIFAHRRSGHAEGLAALDDARRQPQHPDALTQVVQALVLPILKMRHQPRTMSYARLLARELMEGTTQPDHPMRDVFEPLAQRYLDALRSLQPLASQADLAWACQFSLGALAMHLRDQRVERLSQGRAHAADPAAAPRLVTFIAGGLRACLLASPVRATGERSTG
ncbi:MAG: TetR family transcriptional regulator [Hydrogenophaga sp.]|nr:TetR family transcriptional regulator [Hydrogenophaga sp.]